MEVNVKIIDFISPKATWEPGTELRSLTGFMEWKA